MLVLFRNLVRPNPLDKFLDSMVDAEWTGGNVSLNKFASREFYDDGLRLADAVESIKLQNELKQDPFGVLVVGADAKANVNDVRIYWASPSRGGTGEYCVRQRCIDVRNLQA